MNWNSLTADSETTGNTDNLNAQNQDVARWRVTDVEALLNMSFNDLLFRAQEVHRQFHDPNGVQLSTLLAMVFCIAGCVVFTRYRGR